MGEPGTAWIRAPLFGQVNWLLEARASLRGAARALVDRHVRSCLVTAGLGKAIGVEAWWRSDLSDGSSPE